LTKSAYLLYKASLTSAGLLPAADDYLSTSSWKAEFYVCLPRSHKLPTELTTGKKEGRKGGREVRREEGRREARKEVSLCSS
jgi:hypothetical protein